MDIDVTIEPAENIDVTVDPAANIQVEISNGRPGLPTGGTTGQVLKKASASDYDTSWQNESGGGGASNWGDLGGTLSDQTDLQTALDLKSDESDVIAALAGKASISHGHAIADVTNLQTTLDGKSATGHTHTKADVGLGNVDNTSDLAKPVSTATQTALDGKSNTGHTHVAANVTDFDSAVDARIATVVDSAPAALDTLNELAAALGDDADFAGTVTTSLAGKSDVGHTHAIADTTGLQTALDGKASTAVTDDLATDIADLDTVKMDINYRYWNGTGGVGTWDARPTVPTGRHVDAYSVDDALAPPPDDAVAKDIWHRHPDAT